jgi:hypothetical protein
MTTVLSVGNGSNELRCDRKCHDASQFSECRCVCSGRFHGRGEADVIARVKADVAAGVFGPTIALLTTKTLKIARERNPDAVRFHEREVQRAVTSARHRSAGAPVS